MSFTKRVKEEIVKHDFNQCCYLYLLWGMLKSRGTISLSDKKNWVFTLKTSYGAIAKFAYVILEKLGVKKSFEKIEEHHFNKKKKYIIIINDIKKMMEIFAITTPFIPNPDLSNVEICCRKSYLIGMFLHSGSVNSPKSKNYHFEIASSRKSTVDILENFLWESFQIPSKIVIRGNDYLLYIKKANLISDILKILGAQQSVLHFENERAKKDYAVSVTRIINTDFANRKKARLAAERQIVEIEDALLHVDVEKFSDFEINYIELRNEFPDYNLSELAEELAIQLKMNVSKSKLNHTIMKFRKIAKIKRALDK